MFSSSCMDRSNLLGFGSGNGLKVEYDYPLRRVSLVQELVSPFTVMSVFSGATFVMKIHHGIVHESNGLYMGPEERM